MNTQPFKHKDRERFAAMAAGQPPFAEEARHYKIKPLNVEPRIALQKKAIRKLHVLLSEHVLQS